MDKSSLTQVTKRAAAHGIAHRLLLQDRPECQLRPIVASSREQSRPQEAVLGPAAGGHEMDRAPWLALRRKAAAGPNPTCQKR